MMTHMSTEATWATPPPLDDQMEHAYGRRSGLHNLRPRRNPRSDYSACAQVVEGVVAPIFNVSRLASLNDSLKPLLNVALTQFGVCKGLKLFEEKGDAAIQAEMQQLHTRKAMLPISGPTLTEVDRLSALRYLIFLKQNRDGSMRGRGCADGRK